MYIQYICKTLIFGTGKDTGQRVLSQLDVLQLIADSTTDLVPW